jgi:hypothetical protein
MENIMDETANFPNRKNDIVRVLLDVKQEDKENITLGLLCNILMQTRENYELIHLLYRALGLNISGDLKKKLEDWHETDSAKISLFLTKFAQDIEFEKPKDNDANKS